MNLFDQISKDIIDAMKAKDKIRLEALRGAKKEFIEAKTAKDSDGELTDEQATKILQKMVKQRTDAAEIFISQQRTDLSDKELEEISVLEKYLPKQLTAEELEAKLREIITKVGATSAADMGKVMGVASKELAGLAAGKTISETVKKILG